MWLYHIPIIMTLSRALNHWGWVTHICVSRLTIIGSDNGLPPDWRQTIIWTNAGILLIGPLGTNFSEILIKILIFSFKKMRLKVSSAKRRPFCLGLNVLIMITLSRALIAGVPDTCYHYSYEDAHSQYPQITKAMTSEMTYQDQILFFSTKLYFTSYTSFDNAF